LASRAVPPNHAANPSRLCANRATPVSWGF